MDKVILIPLKIEELRSIIGETVKHELAAIAPQPAATQPEQGTKLITRKQAAVFLGVSLVTLDKWVKDGIIPAYRVNSRIRFKKTELERSLTTLFTHKQRRA